MIVGVPKETVSGERRVALVPDLVPKLQQAGLEIVVERAAGEAAGFLDAAYVEKGARVEPQVIERADILLKVQPPTADEVGRIAEGTTLIGLLQPYRGADEMRKLAQRRLTAFAMELMPRITRAQAMDVLSAMSTV